MIGEMMMLYPIFSIEDGTEATASNPDEKGNIKLYVEKFDHTKDMFDNATFLLPGVAIVSSSGYSADELVTMQKEYSEIQNDIVDYVMEQVKQNA